MKIRGVFFVFMLLAALPGAVFSAGDDPDSSSDSQSAPPYYAQGRAQVNSGNWSRAAALFRKAVEQDGKNYKALNMLGFSLRQSGRHREAIQAYGRALSIKPDYAQALEYRGKAHIGAGNRRAALADYERLVRLGSPLAEDLKEAIDRLAKN